MNPESHLLSARGGPARLKPFTCASVLILALAVAHAIELVSARDPSVSASVSANADSVSPWLSPDGRFVLFSSAASDIVPADNGYFGLDVYLHDRLSNTTVLVSANFTGTGGGNGNSIGKMVSTNGRFVLFESDASNLVPGDTNGAADVFVRDLQTGSTILVSVAADGGVGNSNSYDAVMTPDGRYVAFVSRASNLVPDDTNGCPDVFVRDLVGNVTTLVSVGATGTNAVMETPVISADGQRVAFFSTAKGLVADVPATSRGEIYLCDLQSGAITWVSSNAATIGSNVLNLADMPSFKPVMSSDGRYVAFKTGWTNNTAPSAPGVPAVLVFHFDSMTKALTVVSTNGFARWTLEEDVSGPEMTPDGRYVAFVITNTELQSTSVMLWDAHSGETVPVSVALDDSIPTNTASHTPMLSADGRFVAFVSNATNLVTNVLAPVYPRFHIYVRDLQAGVTKLVNVDTTGVGAPQCWGNSPAISADGRFVAFCTPEASLVSGDNNTAYDVFVRDTVADTTELISRRSSIATVRTTQGLSLLGPCSVSADGSRVAYASYASDLVPNDFNRCCDVFVRDLVNGSNILVSVGLDGNAAAGGDSMTPVISGNGRFVAFISAATNLVANDTNGAVDVFLRDLELGTTTLVSVDSNGKSLGTGGASDPVISSDGRYVAFLFTGADLSASRSVYWRDTVAGRTVWVWGPAATNAPSMSADGQRIAYFRRDGTVAVWDAQLSSHIYSFGSWGPIAFALSPGGDRLLVGTTNTLQVRSLPAGTVLFQTNAIITNSNPRMWSGDGRFFTFVTPTKLVPIDDNGTNDVYLCDLQTRLITLVSANYHGTAAANGPSDWPVISGNGRFVIFRSFATDLVPASVNTPALYCFDRLTGTTTLLASSSSGTGWSSWLTTPVIARDASAMIFSSWDSGLVVGDLNRASDVFWLATGLPSDVDTDGDGIPDWWMLEHFGHPAGQENDLSRAQDDADGDGMTNLQEYLAGTVPTDPNSVFKVRIFLVPDAGGTNAVLTWPAIRSKSYRVQFKTDLDSSWADVTSGVYVIGNEGRYTNPVSSTTRFFRVVLTE